MSKKQINSLVKSVKSWTPDRDILELREFLLSLGELTDTPESYISEKDIKRSKDFKKRNQGIWGIEDRGYCLVKQTNAWDFVVSSVEHLNYTLHALSNMEEHTDMKSALMKLYDEQTHTPADAKRMVSYRCTEDFLSLAKENAKIEGMSSIQKYLDRLILQDAQNKRIKPKKK